jgi:multidrug resistance efflux pump
MSDGAQALPEVRPKLGKTALWLKPGLLVSSPMKMGFIGMMLLAGLYGLLSEQKYVSSGSAVVTTYVTSVRTPIEGTLSDLSLSPGSAVETGTVLARVTNPRADAERLSNLRIEQQQTGAGADAARAETEALLQERAHLQERVSAHSQAVFDRLHQQAAQAQMLLQARQAALEQASSDFERGHKLRDVGIIAQAEFEVLQSRQHVAAAEAAAQEAELRAIKSAEFAATRGLLTEVGTSSDVASSQQRIDEINLRLVEAQRRRTVLEAQSHQATSDLAEGQQRLDLLRQTALIAPVSGEVWKLAASNGEHVEAGGAVAELVNCGQSFLLALVPQNRLSQIEIGAEVRFPLSGESVDHVGSVAAILGAEQDDEHRKLAARPFHEGDERMATLRVNFPQTADRCAVGRVARVSVATTGGSLLSRLRN